jgi:hypothetical protein
LGLISGISLAVKGLALWIFQDFAADYEVMMRLAMPASVLAVLALTTIVVLGQPVSGVFFTTGWESGTTTGSFNSSFYGSGGPQFAVQSAVRATGQWAFRHTLPGGGDPGAIQYATQHFGDAPDGPVPTAGQGQHFNDLYVQYKVYYSPGFDFAGFSYKQVIIGTQDDRRHDNACCNPWVSHYMTIYPPGRNLLAEANNKQTASSQWVGFAQNQSGYGSSNLLTTQTGRWYTMEVRRRLNDSGVDNGIFQMWVDGVLLSDFRAVRYRVPWNGTFGANFTYGTNFVMISDYGAPPPQDQSIYYDDFKFSTTYIGVDGGQTTPPAPPTNVRVVR